MADHHDNTQRMDEPFKDIRKQEDLDAFAQHATSNITRWLDRLYGHYAKVHGLENRQMTPEQGLDLYRYVCRALCNSSRRVGLYSLGYALPVLDPGHLEQYGISEDRFDEAWQKRFTIAEDIASVTVAMIDKLDIGQISMAMALKKNLKLNDNEIMVTEDTEPQTKTLQ